MYRGPDRLARDPGDPKHGHAYVRVTYWDPAHVSNSPENFRAIRTSDCLGIRYVLGRSSDSYPGFGYVFVRAADKILSGIRTRFVLTSSSEIQTFSISRDYPGLGILRPGHTAGKDSIPSVFRRLDADVLPSAAGLRDTGTRGEMTGSGHSLRVATQKHLVIASSTIVHHTYKRHHLRTARRGHEFPHESERAEIWGE